MLTLSELPYGALARIISVEGGYGLVQKLSLMGLSEGKIVQVISSTSGPVIIEIERNVVALGRGMAKRIMVMRI